MSGYNDFSDSELIDLLQASDHCAYTEMYERYFELVFLQAYTKLRDEEQAKDIVQEVFVNLWVNRGGIGPVLNLAGYLVTAVRNRVFNFFAHQEVGSRYIQSLADYPVDVYSSSSDHRVREKEFAAYIEKAVQSLPKKMKLIFELSRKEHLNHKQIADKLGTSEHNVSKQVTNALRILRTKLGSILTFLFPI